MNKVLDVGNHVRYVIALMRADGAGKPYAAMKISIEVADSLVEERVNDIIARAIRRELPSEEDVEGLISDVSTVVRSWLTALQFGNEPRLLRVGKVTLYDEQFFPSKGVKQYIQTSIFTKENEAKAEKLFAKL
jgi:hypothetical protein